MGTAVAQVRHHSETGVDGGPQLIERRIRVAGGDSHSAFLQQPRHRASFIRFRREGNKPNQPGSRVEQPSGHGRIGRANGVLRMRAAIFPTSSVMMVARMPSTPSARRSNAGPSHKVVLIVIHPSVAVAPLIREHASLFM